MTCVEAREAMLEADLADLRGEGDSELTRHLADCAACAAAARGVLVATAGLEAARPAGRAAAPEVATWAVARAAAIRRRRRWAVVPLLAAAGFSAVWLARGGAPPEPPAAAPAPAVLPTLVSSNAGHVAVLRTGNPKIVVVWQF